MIRKTILLFVGVFMAVSLFAFPRKVLMEDYGSTTCGPCAGLAQWLDPLAREYEHEGELVPIAYHMSWPSNSDPWHLSNPAPNNARRTYYNVSAIPEIRFDGELLDPRTEDRAIEMIEERLAVDSPLALTMESEFRNDSILVSIEAEVSEAIDNATMHIALIQDSCFYNAPSGQLHFFSAMVDMYPDGEGLPFELQSGTQVYDAIFPNLSQFDHLPDWGLPNLKVVCFVQNNTTREVINAQITGIPLSFPYLTLASDSLDDTGGNGDGRPEAGELGQLVLGIQNHASFADAENVSVTVTVEDPGITMTVEQVDYGTIPEGEAVNNADSPFVFSVNDGFTAHRVTFEVLVESSTHGWEASYSIQRMIGWPQLLVWDQDSLDVEEYYFSALSELVPYDYWDETEQILSSERINKYSTVIYFTGRRSVDIMNESMQMMVEEYLDSGGNMVLSSQHLGTALGNTDFFQNVIRAREVVDDMDNDRCIGLPNSSIFAGTEILLTGSGGADNNRSPGSIEPMGNAESDFYYEGTVETASIHWSDVTSGAKLVYFAFPLESISGEGGTASLYHVATELFQWLDLELGDVDEPATAIQPSEFRVLSVYPNPFNAKTTIRYQLAHPQRIQVVVYDILGREIEELYDGEQFSGTHSVMFHARNVASGQYFFQLKGENQVDTRKIILIK